MQVRGPYALWHHTHTFADRGDGTTLMRDEVRYAVGFGALAHRLFVARDVGAIFDFRAGAIAAQLRTRP